MSKQVKQQTTRSTSSTRRQKPMSPPAGYSGRRSRYGDGGKVK